MKSACHPNTRVRMGERSGAAKNHRGDPVESPKGENISTHHNTTDSATVACYMNGN